MERTFSQIECAAIQHKLEEIHSVNSIRMWQNIGHPNYLIVSLGDVSTRDIMKLEDMGLIATIFGAGMRVELWLSKMN